MSAQREARIHFVNIMVKSGYTLATAADVLGVSHTTASRLYYGFADNCLPYNTKKSYSMGRDTRSVMYEGASVPL